MLCIYINIMIKSGSDLKKLRYYGLARIIIPILQ